MKFKKEVIVYSVIIVAFWAVFLVIKNRKPSKGHEAFEPIEPATEQVLTTAHFKDKVIKMEGIPEDTVVDIRYQLKNTGQEPLIIDYINPDCSCTSCHAIDSIINPGDSTYIVMSFNTTNKAGFNKINSVVRLNTSASLYKLSAIVDVVQK